MTQFGSRVVTSSVPAAFAEVCYNGGTAYLEVKRDECGMIVIGETAVLYTIDANRIVVEIANPDMALLSTSPCQPVLTTTVSEVKQADGAVVVGTGMHATTMTLVWTCSPPIASGEVATIDGVGVPVGYTACIENVTDGVTLETLDPCAKWVVITEVAA